MGLTIKIRDCEIGNGTKIVSVIGGKDWKKQIDDSIEQGADILEARLDLGLSLSILERIRNHTNLPLISTIRRVGEGGRYNEITPGDRLNRVALYESIIDAGLADLIDIDLRNTPGKAELIEKAKEHNIYTIASYHNFNETPLQSFMSICHGKAAEIKADILKLAYMAKTKGDLIDLYKFLESERDGKMLIAGMCMGEIGKSSRIIASYFGSCLTYGYVGENPVAPGQIPIKTMKHYLEEYSAEKIGKLSVEEAANLEIELVS